MQNDPTYAANSGTPELAADPTYAGSSGAPEPATDPTYTGTAAGQRVLPAEESTPLYTHHGEGHHSHKHVHGEHGFHLHRHHHESGEQEHVHNPDDTLHEQHSEHHLFHRGQ